MTGQPPRGAAFSSPFEVSNKAPNAVAHDKVLVSIAQAFDQNVDFFGQHDYRGPLSAMT